MTKIRNEKGIGLLSLILIIVAIVVIAGIIAGVVILNKYKNKEPLTAKEFETKMEELGFEVYDATYQFEIYDYVENVFVAIKGNNEYQIEFFETNSEETAIYGYNINKSDFEEYKSSKYAETNIDIGNNSKYTLTTGDKYKVISRIGNTFIFVNVDKEYKDDVKDILSKLGY